MINADARICGMRAIEMENEWLQVTILPEVGAKIYDLLCKRTGRNFLWHNPRIAPQPYPIEGIFDNYWCGGWDDCFPTCDACELRGEHYPGLGELRSLHWEVESADSHGEDSLARLSAFGPISPVRAEKRVVLAGNAPVLRMQYEITNLGMLPLDFIWGTHPALQPTGEMSLRIPARTGIVGEASTLAFGAPGQRYHWPSLETIGQVVDISRVQGSDLGAYCGHYVTDLEEGWYAVEDRLTGEGFLLQFPLDICPYLWLWLTYGGYRGHHHVIVEPWTSYPVNLAKAISQKTSRCLRPGEKFSVEVCATVYTRPETCQEALKRVSQ
ncbi:MAG: DUF5107 domain-containing protein [Acidobacteria bacterium]|nr:DUF5107 domain-containing protein [Acidobacteriota bacterium]MCI0718713.1 DUF5107 domain-containing protein [Acidobacteriota bacterium]